MYFNLEVHLSIEGTGILSKGRFVARKKSDIPRVAYEIVRDIKRQTGYRKTTIQQIIVNGIEDITEEVQKIECLPIPPIDNIFW